MRDAGHSRRDQDRPGGRRSGELSGEGAEVPTGGLGPAAEILHLQRTIGNRAVGQILRGAQDAPVIQRQPESSDGGAAAGTSAPAPAAAKIPPLVSTLRGRPFPWEAEPEPKVPTISLLNRWLDFYNFHERRPLGDDRDGCDFNLDFTFKVDNVVNIFLIDSRGAGFAYDAGLVRDAILANLRPKQAAQAQIEDDINQGRRPGPGATGPPGEGGGAGNKKDDDNATQIAIAWTFVPSSVHKNLKTGEKSSDPAALQVAGQLTLQLHKDGQRGFELTAAGQATFFADPGAPKPRLQNVSAVGQAAWVTPFLTEFIQLQAVAQVLLGANLVANQAVSDKISGPRLQAAAQVAVGPQVVFTIPGTDKHLQVVGQAQGGVGTAGGSTTLDKSAGVGVQWVF